MNCKIYLIYKKCDKEKDICNYFINVAIYKQNQK